ncbi:hypothetical protein HJG60_011271 [Phyllostomus discolor]|uniref:Uncharacterized protein n=1 Tax=Phyllostomus discolor TaxID=89673 RepID=A0A834A4G4_9CHIR|nr:hypothetical protein HJG60_011271 [Phyllostomus discolor]
MLYVGAGAGTGGNNGGSSVLLGSQTLLWDPGLRALPWSTITASLGLPAEACVLRDHRCVLAPWMAVAPISRQIFPDLRAPLTRASPAPTQLVFSYQSGCTGLLQLLGCPTSIQINPLSVLGVILSVNYRCSNLGCVRRYGASTYSSILKEIFKEKIKMYSFEL